MKSRNRKLRARRRLAGLVLLAAALRLLTACGGGDDDPPACPVVTPDNVNQMTGDLPAGHPCTQDIRG